MFTLLEQMKVAGVIRALDFHFAQMLARQHQPHLAFAAAFLSAELGTGNVCLPLQQLTYPELSLRFPDFSPQLLAELGELTVDEWQVCLQQADWIGDGNQATPLVLQHKRLYLQRLWRDEGDVADFFCQDTETASVLNDEQLDKLMHILDDLFPCADKHDEINWQKVAVAVAVTRRVAVISGGPGTGKTTTVARLLSALIRLYAKRPLRIQLAAPTGKAAARLTESLTTALLALELTPEQRAQLPQEAFTLHRLLGAVPDSHRLRYHRDNPLHLDVLVVDEASMVDLPMMARLIEALPPAARLILLGDRDQLASVEAGAVLGELCRFAEYGYRPKRADELSRLCQYSIAAGDRLPDAVLRDGLCLLKKSYRFDDTSGIGQLAMAVNAGDSERVWHYIHQGQYQDITWLPQAQNEDYQTLIDNAIDGYRTTMQAVAQQRSPAEILQIFNHFRLLCALREGVYGQKGLNLRIEHGLSRAGLIHRGLAGKSIWYAGRPVMVTRNDRIQRLFNGDIGITLNAPSGELRVYFQLTDGTIKGVLPSRLLQVETAYAMTVHKSQGSEFEHTLMVMPSHISAVLTRELLYTAITRAKSQLTLFGRKSVINHAIDTPIQRRSGLVERILSVKS